MSDDAPRMDKSAGGVYRRGEEPSDLAFWLSRPPEERLAALELIRRRIYGPDYDAPPGLLRVGRVLRRS